MANVIIPVGSGKAAQVKLVEQADGTHAVAVTDPAVGDATLPAAETDTGSYGIVQFIKRLLVKVTTYIDRGSRAAPMARIVDTTVANTTYICEAAPGTSASVANWRISRTVVSGTVTTTTWAGGFAAFDQVANNRTSLTYS